ncbi:MAG: large repetitive protein [Solirubrobacteraceae bacterium]|jgi:plastocyanin|nr:large repetitive protein [Solirubrobacteraceae bacterium]
MTNLAARCRTAAALLGVCITALAAQAPAAFAADHAVDLTTSRTFSPATVSAAPGDTVTWHWTENRRHTITPDAGQSEAFGVTSQSSGTYVHAFATAGRFTYRCTLHSNMTGVVVVAAPSSTPDTTPPGVPSAVVATAGDGSVTLDWADSSAVDLAHYVVQRRTGAGAWGTVASPLVSGYTDTAVTNATTYSYRVSAVDTTSNASAFGTIVSATPAAAAPPPPSTGPVTRHVAIANYLFGPSTITVNSGDTVAWDWTGADVNHSVTSTNATPAFDSHLGLADNQITGPPAGGFSHTFNQIGSFTYVCRVHNAMTGTVKVVAPPATPDTTPPAVPAATAATATATGVTIDWADSSAPDLGNYVVERQVGAGAWTTVGAPAASVFVDSTVSAGTTYSYRVSAVDLTGNTSAPSAVVSATTPAPAPAPAPVAAAGPLTRHVAVGGYQFAPAVITVNRGDTVAWDWSGTDLNHSVSSLGGLLDSFDSHLGALVSTILGPPPGGFAHTFNQVGSFPYLCRVHTDMTGTVTVVASGAPDVQLPNPAAANPAAPPAAQAVKAARTAKQFDVKIADFAFAPAKLSIAAGDVVTWHWSGKDTNHSVTSAAGSAESFESHPGLKISAVTSGPAGGTFSHVFTHEGTFKYLCRVHPGMTGQVTVGAAPVRVRIAGVRRASGSVRVSYRLTRPAAVRAVVYRAGKRVAAKAVKGRSGANSLRLVLPPSARHAVLRVVLRAGGAQARAAVRAPRG